MRLIDTILISWIVCSIDWVYYGKIVISWKNEGYGVKK
jgi:hypothetical protein